MLLSCIATFINIIYNPMATDFFTGVYIAIAIPHIISVLTGQIPQIKEN